MLAAARAGLVAIGSPDRWLVALRWIAAAAMIVTTIAGKAILPSLNIAPVLAAIGGILLLNLAWWVRVQRDQEPNETVALQLVGDLIAISAVLWFSGGLTNPFAGFLVFQIVLAGLLGTRRTTVTVALLAVAAAIALDSAQPLSFEGARWGAETTAHVASVVSVAALGAMTGVFVFVYASRLEQLRNETARAEKLAGLGRTVAAMCHELNTPLGTILIAGKDLALVGRQIGSTEIEELADTVAEGARRAADIIGMMRGSISPDARREAVELFSFVRRYAAQELDRKGFRGERFLDCDGNVEVKLVRSALCQILTNLLANAVEATAAVGRPVIAVEVAARDTEVEVTIRDNGPGVDSDVMPHLGEPFRTTKADSGGTGLGLYVSNLLAEHIGGALHLETRAGRGTSVTLTLTRDRVRNSQVMRAAEPASAAGASPSPEGATAGVPS